MITNYEEFGFEVNDGWISICQKVVDTIEEYNRNRDIKDQIKICQIKSKFGQLRVHLCKNNDECTLISPPPGIQEFIRDCEDECSHTCEFCGSQDTVTTFSYKGWIRTLCNKCKNELINK